MATATWFDYNAYMANKLVQVNAIDPKVQYTPETLKAEFEKAGYVGEEGAFKHFEQYGKTEDVAPNALFDADEYITAKAADFFKTDKPTASQIAEVTKAFADGGMSAWDHYVTYGSSEGVEPSFSFNTDAYLTAKAAALNAGKYDGKENWTAEDVAAAIKASGSTVLEHFMANGGGGELEVAVSYKGITEGGAKNPFIDPTPPTPVPAPNPGETFTLGTGTNELTGTEKDDTFSGVTELQGTKSTLHAKDKLDGGLGVDTLKLDMSFDFNGFSADGGMKDIEVLDLANKSALSRTFNATGATDIETIKIDANNQNFTVNKLAAADVTVEVSNMSGAKDVTIAYADKVTDGTADSLTAVLNGVGTVKGDKVAEAALNVKSAGIENLEVVSDGATGNVVNLAGVSNAETLTVSGSQNLKVNAVATTLKEVTAIAASGDLNLNLSGATIESLSLGKGNDKVMLSKLAPEAAFDGGAGKDELILNGVSGVWQPEIKGFETLSLMGITGDLTLAASGVTDLTDLNIINGLANNVTVAEFGGNQLNVHLKDEATGFGTDTGTLKITSEGAITLDTSTVNTNQAYTTVLDAQSASTLNINVGGKTTYSGKVDADSAKDFALTVAKDGTYSSATSVKSASNVAITTDGVVSSAINAGSAANVTVDAGLNATIGALNITANKATQVNIASKINADVTITASSFKAAENVVLSAAQGLVATGVTFGGDSQSITIDGTGVKGALTLGVADTTQENAAATIIGSKLGVNTLTVGSGYTSVNVKGGISNDIVNLNTVINGGEANLTFDLGTISTADTLTLASADHDWTNATVSLDGVDIIGGAGANTTLVANASLFSGKTVAFTGGTALTSVVLHATNAAGEVIDASKLVTNASSVLDILGSDGNDTITAASTGGTIEGGLGKDTINLGAGVDTIVLTSLNAADADTIIGFSGGADSIDMVAISDAMSDAQSVANNGASSAYATGKMNVISASIGGKVFDDAKAIASDASIAAAFGTAGYEGGIASIDSDGNWNIWYINNATGDTLDANEITLLGTVKDLVGAELAAGHFSFS